MQRKIITKECSCVKKMGRILYRDEICWLIYSAAQIGFTYTGETLSAELVTNELYKEQGFEGMVGVFVGDDEEPWMRFLLQKPEGGYELFDRTAYAKAKNMPVDALPKELPIRIVKFSEAAFGAVGIRALIFDDLAEIAPLPKKTLTMEFIGDSITCGYGNEGVLEKDVFNTAQENPFKAYAVLTAKAMDADYQLVSWSGIGLISDYVPPERDDPDETILAGENYKYTAMKFCENMGYEKERWDFTTQVPDIVVINLGTNDDSYTREIPERMDTYAEKYKELYRFVRGNYPKAKIVCGLGIMTRGLDKRLGTLVEQLRAEGDPDVHFLEFDVIDPNDGYGTDWHPNLITHRLAAKQLVEKLREIM